VIAARRVRGVGSSPTSPRRLDPALRGWVGGWEWGVGGGGGYCHHVSDVSAPVRQAAAATRPLLSPRVRRVGPSPGGRCRHATVIVTTCPTCRPQSGRPLPPCDRYVAPTCPTWRLLSGRPSPTPSSLAPNLVSPSVMSDTSDTGCLARFHVSRRLV
jgi:hypothetical protein